MAKTLKTVRISGNIIQGNQGILLLSNPGAGPPRPDLSLAGLFAAGVAAFVAAGDFERDLRSFVPVGVLDLVDLLSGVFSEGIFDDSK